jgi:hypothetical protein
MDEISQDPKLNIRLARGRWLEVAVAAVLIAVAARPGGLARNRLRCAGLPADRVRDPANQLMARPVANPLPNASASS